MTQAQGGRRNRRQLSDLANMSRTAVGPRMNRAAEVVAPPNHPPEWKFSPSAVWEWVRSYLAYLFHSKHLFVPASASPQNAVFGLGGDDGTAVKIAIAGDWATGTDEAAAVATRMEDFDPGFTIHIGDVYYVGDPAAVNENCLGIMNPNNNYDPVTWPIGKSGSFALNGNHEMYANGTGYFEVFLPRLGLKQADGSISRQQTSFFCLENKFWRIIAIDTGYNSIGVPILSQIPWVNNIPGIGGNCKLEDELMKWLRTTVKPADDLRGLVILSHHLYYSAFETRYRKPAQQLWKAGIKRPVIWFWGHEHRLAGYGLEGSDDLKAYGRCVGHGGMPVELGDPNRNKGPRPVFYDNRVSPNGFGMNGHANLTFAGNTLTALYVDLGGKELLREKWSVDSSGAIALIEQKKIINDPNFHAGTAH